MHLSILRSSGDILLCDFLSRDSLIFRISVIFFFLRILCGKSVITPVRRRILLGPLIHDFFPTFFGKKSSLTMLVVRFVFHEINFFFMVGSRSVLKGRSHWDRPRTVLGPPFTSIYHLNFNSNHRHGKRRFCCK